MSAAKRSLVHKLSRYVEACERIEAAHDEAFNNDSAVDAGEFSGPAHMRAVEREQEQVAQRFGFESKAVADQAVNAFLRGRM